MPENSVGPISLPTGALPPGDAFVYLTCAVFIFRKVPQISKMRDVPGPWDGISDNWYRLIRRLSGIEKLPQLTRRGL